MKNPSRILLSILAIAMSFLSHPASAGERVALVIGGDDYDHLPQDAQLKVAVSDARLLANSLKALEPQFSVTLLENPTRLEAGKALDAFVDDAKEAECALVYFAGHGIEYNGENFLLNKDTKVSGISEDVDRMKRRLRTEAVSLQSMVDDLDATRAQVKIVILDACRDNPLQAETGSGTRSVVGSKGGLASVTPPSGTLISYAADAGQQANDGLFTAVLARNLTTPGKTIMEVFATTRAEVLSRSSEMAQNGKGVRHEPAEYVKLNPAGIRFSFLPGNPAGGNSDLAAKLKEMQERNAELEKAMANRDTSAAEIQRLRAKLAEASKEAGDTMKKTEPEMVPPTVPGGGFSAGKRSMEGSRAGEVREFGGIEFVWCPPGEFLMGSPASEEERQEDEKQHRVTLTKGFWMAKTECTQGQWESVMGTDVAEQKSKGDSFGDVNGVGAKHPMYFVSWDDCQEWLAKMNREHALPEGWKWVLPSEAQWEYACRAGTETAYVFGNDAGELHKYGNFADKNFTVFDWGDKTQDDRVGNETAEVGKYLPNEWGLLDMHGNIWEWCADWYGEDYYSDGQRDPEGPNTGSNRVSRGGSWFNSAQYCRAAYRYRYSPSFRRDNLGFRVALTSLPAK